MVVERKPMEIISLCGMVLEEMGLLQEMGEMDLLKVTMKKAI